MAGVRRRAPDDIDALQILYSRPYGKRLTLKAIKELAATIGRPPHNWTPERLWAAYEALEASRVRGSAGTQFTNLVSLVRKALDPDGELVAYPLTVDERFQSWLAQQTQAGTTFTDEQLVWLTSIKDHLATSLTIAPDDFELEPFVGHGGYGRANSAFAGQPRPAARRAHPGARRMTELPRGWAAIDDLCEVCELVAGLRTSNAQATRIRESRHFGPGRRRRNRRSGQRGPSFQTAEMNSRRVELAPAPGDVVLLDAS